jgi:hypothetical protein
VNLKGEYPPPMSLAEIANICYVHSGRKPSKHTVKRVLSEDPIPLKMMKRFDPYHEIPEPKEWASPARADTLPLRDPSFFHSILLEIRGTPVAKRRVQPTGVVEGL